MEKFLGQDISEKERWQFLRDNADAVEKIGYTHRFTPEELAQKKEALAETSIQINLFKGFACEEIEVEIYADVDGRDVSLSLVSAGANEAIEEYKNKVIDEQLDAIRQIAPDIVIIEV